MYNTKFPVWEDATSTGNKKYDGQFAYAYAKRGQVLLCERWAVAHPKVSVNVKCTAVYFPVKTRALKFAF